MSPVLTRSCKRVSVKMYDGPESFAKRIRVGNSSHILSATKSSASPYIECTSEDIIHNPKAPTVAPADNGTTVESIPAYDKESSSIVPSSAVDTLELDNINIFDAYPEIYDLDAFDHEAGLESWGQYVQQK